MGLLRKFRRQNTDNARKAGQTAASTLAWIYLLPLRARVVIAMLVLGRGDRRLVAVVFLALVFLWLIAMGLAAVLGLWLGVRV